MGNEVRAYLAECWDRPEGLSPTHLQVVHFISSQSSITTSCGDSALLLDQPTSALGPCRHDRAHTRLGNNGMMMMTTMVREIRPGSSGRGLRRSRHHQR